MIMTNNLTRCEWAGEEQEMRDYHDKEWGVPVHDEQELFELLILEGAQAGLSWATILKRRKGYREAFANFEIPKVANFTEMDFFRLIEDERIIRNKLKVKSAINNAQRFLEVQNEFGSFNEFIWAFIGHKPIQNAFKSLLELPASTPLSEKISNDLKKRGFNFVGPTICYAYMQSIGMVNDHVVTCFRYNTIKNMK
jgi:DNA-3-methyladenine glycosylase I